MKEMNKKYAVRGIASVMLMWMLVFMLPVLAKANYRIEGDWRYRVNEDRRTVTVTEWLESEKSVNIPAILGGKKVVGISDGCFRNNDEIEEVVKQNFDKTVEFTRFALAEQYRESLKIKECLQQK